MFDWIPLQVTLQENMKNDLVVGDLDIAILDKKDTLAKLYSCAKLVGSQIDSRNYMIFSMITNRAISFLRTSVIEKVMSDCHSYHFLGLISNRFPQKCHRRNQKFRMFQKFRKIHRETPVSESLIERYTNADLKICLYLCLHKNNMPKISHYNSIYFLRSAQVIYVKCLFTNTQKQQHMLKISLLFKKSTNFKDK